MTFDDDANIRGGRISRRGRNTGIAVGGGGLGVVAILLISQLLGVDLSGIFDPDAGGAPGPVDSLEQCQTGEDANESIDCRMKGASASLETYWANSLDGYTSPGDFVLFTGSVNTGCGGAPSAVGPFYCPGDRIIYLDTAFFDDLQSRFGASGGALAQMYVVAHEWGHHVQNITGIMEGLDLRDTGPASDAVRLELQADCFAGAWVGAASDTEDESGVAFLEPVTDREIQDALSAASAVGDDRIQESTTGQVNPEAWTHGSSEQRQRWFLIGRDGGPNACDTFGASEL